MLFQYLTPDSIKEDLCDDLNDQGVCTDDWDYMLFFPCAFEINLPSAFSSVTLKPKDSHLDELLRGPCHNEWYPVKNFEGKIGILGVAYHS